MRSTLRSILFVVLTLSLASGGFLAYTKFQRPIARLLGRGAPPPPQQLDPKAPAVMNVGAGERPFSKMFDKEGRLSSRFRAADVQPRGSGRIHVTHVEAEFFQYLKPAPPQYPKGRVQLVRIEGKQGDMEVQDSSSGTAGAPGAGGSMQKGTGGAPKRGRLNDVVMRLYRDLQDRTTELSSGGKQGGPMLTLTTNNISFDNETFEIATESYAEPDGRVVPPDEVPIFVVGDYDFVGRGLRLRWNDVEGRLDYLEVAHGEKLVIKHPSDLRGGPGSPDGTSKGTFAAMGGPLTDASGVPIMLAARDKKAVAVAQPATPRSAPASRAAPARNGQNKAADRSAGKKDSDKGEHHGPQPPYRATFLNEVHITQGEEGRSERELALADVMTVDFHLGQSKPTTQPTTQPATPPAAQPAGPTPSAPAPSVVPSAPSATTAIPATQPQSGEVAQSNPAGPAPAAPVLPTTQPTTRPADPDQEPVIVRWTGPLKILPIEPTDPDAPIGLKPGESVLHLLGNRAPVVVTRDTSTVRCATLDYFSADGSVAIHPSPQFPQVVMTQHPAGPTLPAGPSAATASVRPAPKDGGQDATILAESLIYSGTDRIAVLHGHGSAHIVQGGGETMNVRWTRSARLYFAPGSKDMREGMQLDQATLLGDVDVQHPQLSLRSQALDLIFDRPSGSVVPATPATRPAAQLAAADVPGPPDTLGTRHPRDRTDKSQADQPDLHKIIATQSVWCDLKDQSGKQQTVLCDRLALETAAGPDGKRYPRLINADGNAHAYDAEQDLEAGHIQLTLVPAKPKPVTPAAPQAATSMLPTTRATFATTRPAAARPAPRSADSGGIETAQVELETMTARDDVRVVSADGSIATAGEMYVEMHDGQPHARLVGRPKAIVVDAKQNVVTGPVITVDPRRNVAKVEGRGSLRATQQDEPGVRENSGREHTGRVIDVAWVEGAELNGPINRIFVRGPVAVVTTDPDGSVTTSRSRFVTIELVDKLPAAVTPLPGTTLPTTRPSGQDRGGRGGAARAPGGNGPQDGMKMDFMKDKDVRAIVLQDEQEAVVQSSLKAADGTILREFELKSKQIRYDLLGPAPGAAPVQAAQPSVSPQGMNGRLAKLTVPGPGTLLVRDHRPPEPKQAKPAGGANGATDLGMGNNRGAMAFQWNRYMVYDEAARYSVMNGQVRVVYQSDDPKEPPATLNAEQVTTWFQPKAARPVVVAGPRPAGAAAGVAAADPASALQLRWLIAQGQAVVARAGSTLTADRIDYDPSTTWLVATGGDRIPATFTDVNGAETTRAHQIWWNTQTWQVQVKDISSRTGTKPPAKAATPTRNGR